MLAASEGLTNRQIEKDYGLEEHRVSQWRTRWHDFHEQWKQLDPELRPKMSAKLVHKWLADAGGRGAKRTITEAQRALILAVACEPTGKMIAPMLHATRTEVDFVRNIENIIATAPDAGWVIVLDHLNTHQSESLVILVARLLDNHDRPWREGQKCCLAGVPGGVLQSMESRKAFLTDKSHRIRFVFTPKHCSWLNQIEIWFSGLTRRVLMRGNFRSVDELKTKILQYIEFYNKNATPMKWKYKPKTTGANCGTKCI